MGCSCKRTDCIKSYRVCIGKDCGFYVEDVDWQLKYTTLIAQINQLQSRLNSPEEMINAWVKLTDFLEKEK